jgi:hypothetical protein
MNRLVYLACIGFSLALYGDSPSLPNQKQDTYQNNQVDNDGTDDDYDEDDDDDAILMEEEDGPSSDQDEEDNN